ncbi:hypothetical protein F0U62_28715 [Cystobacter fuscus]|uniref:DUF4785 family immunoglobulin-like domain-containing protein n=1 Tax=Cystobacter fuscus TaxID=43 RepID=UPI002B281052|nr:hypothetical protein F0U62_28715 [Cystobacter fuscus]
MTFPRSLVQSSGWALAVVLLGGFTPAAPEPSSSMSLATSARRVAGDVAPARLFPREVHEPLAPGLVSVSNPGAPQQPLAPPLAPETRSSKSTVLHVAPGSAPQQLSLPIDTPEDAWVMFIPKGSDAQRGERALRDMSMFDPRGVRADVRAARSAEDALGLNASRLKAEGISRPVTLMRMGREMGAGAYQVRVGAEAARVGMAIEVRLPSSPIELSLTASAMQFFPGEEGYVTVDLHSTARLEKVRFEATLYNPRFEKDRTVPVVRVGQEYRALVSRVLSERDEPGAWVLEVRATGRSEGGDFDRLAQTSVGFAVPTARIVSAGRPRLVRDAAGKVAAFEVDVELESQARDRYEVSGTLVATDRQGGERPVAEAQVTDQLGVGSHTVTLRFDAGHVGLSRMEGAYALRELRLFSLGTNALYHRLGRGLELRMPAASVAEFAAPVMTPAIEHRLKAGDFNVLP